MELATALAVFRELEIPRYEFDATLAPHFNVRLDALTTRDTVDRGFRLFIRVDVNSPIEAFEGNLRYVLDLAREHSLAAVLANDGIELS